MIVLEILKEIVQKVQSKMGKEIFFTFGNATEISEKLILMSQFAESAKKKYPLFAVFTDIKESKGNEVAHFAEVDIDTIVIATFTDKNYHSEQRLELTIKPVLVPIYEEFLEQLAKSSYFTFTDKRQILHDKTDRLSWGQSAIFTDNNFASDFIDAIEINNLKLIIKR